MSWQCAVAVDVGGTFTDLVVSTTSGHRHVTKVPSVAADPSEGVFAAVTAVARDMEVEPSDLLARCDRFVHGSTVATNAVLTGGLAKVGLLTSAGFRDTLEIRRGLRDDQWDHRAPWPPVLVPRYLRLGIGGRIGADGVEADPLDTRAVVDAMRVFEAEDVKAVAICFLHSYRNQAHEHRAAELVRERWPGALTSVSSDLVPLLGEYSRMSTTVVNAGLVPIVGGDLGRLAHGLHELGLAGPLLMLQSNGGTVPVEAVAARPVDLVLSGPAAVGGATKDLASQTTSADNLVSMEIGGTSCDVAVSVGGVVPVVDGLDVGGYHLNVPAVDVHTVGAGGGTIAGVDDAGLLHVGPQGAGADPGPACYGRGGVQPTITDVHLLLGRLRPGPYADGSIRLEPELARRAVQHQVAAPLGLTEEAAALGVLDLLEQHLRHAVETITIERGRDPRAMTLVAAGGAGGLHGVAVARSLGCRRVLIPAEAGVFCAIGMLHSDLRRDLSRSVVGSLAEIGASGLRDALGHEQQRADALRAADWPAGTPTESAWHADLRYPGQLWSVRVAMDERAATADLRARFEAEYERLFGHIQPGGRLEVTGVGVTMWGHTTGHGSVIKAALSSSPQPRDRRPCWIDHATGWAEVSVFDASDLGAGATLKGPFLIEGHTTTVLAGSGDRLLVGPGGDMEVELT